MDRFIARQNIKLFKEQLADGHLDEARQATVQGLLAAEQDKLKKLEAGG